MSRGLVERANSDLGHIANSSTSTATATGDDLHRRQCTNNKQRLALLFSGAGAGAWRRSEAATATSTRAETGGGGGGSKKKHVQGSSIGPRVKKYMAKAEQLLASFSSGGSASGGRRDDDDRRRRRGPSISNSFPSSSGSGRWPSKRHGWDGIRLFSEPASLRGSPANSGRLSARGVIPKAPSSEEDLQSAIQAAIAHCKNSSVAAAKQLPAAIDRARQV
ncbi:probable BRI1 kinase inhibitor 1 [Brachypodium distachyon]|uniref:Uncharacterized protein n=1 Tax=Brachypodium distachyon TaxID=15368 RepID=A0A2K2D1V3_BRADI|nr:probable BRI1 kinase inhibitor 1 [Brachypodium distachyon]PNT68272.1 hypothetical protein BRADI_3g38115v3 [Brachypodium distachyon]|eukprot:XP_010236724.1 probable BRI1 kinase inhibitor 1 [Brachypodium distachyon]